MRILFLTQIVPYPLDAGAKIRAYYTLRQLASSHEVTLLSFTRPSDRAEALDHLRQYTVALHTVPMRRSRLADGRHLLRSLLLREPFLIARDWVPEMAETVRTIAARGEVDAVHADQLWMAPYARLAAAAAPAGRAPLTVLDQHNALFQIPRRLARNTSSLPRRAMLALEAHKMARYEVAQCAAFDRVVWVTDDDRQAVRAMGERLGEQVGGAEEPVIPICVDPAVQPPLERAPTARRVTFLGGLHWPPNAEGVRWFAREVWPAVRARVPAATLTLLGKSPPEELRGLAGIEAPGYVEDPLPYLRESAVFVVPLHAGGGMRVKILDAWCWALPVLSTPIGAEGIATREGENILLAESAPDFADALCRLLEQPELAAHVAAGGRRTVEASYDWRRIYPTWEALYDTE